MTQKKSTFFQPSVEYPPVEESETEEEEFFEPDSNFFDNYESFKTGGGYDEIKKIELPWIYLIYLIKNTLNTTETLDLKNMYIASLLYFFKEENTYFSNKYVPSGVVNYGKKGDEATMYARLFVGLIKHIEKENTIYTIKDLSDFIHDNYTDKANNAMIMGGKNKNTKKYKKVTRGTKRSRTKRSRTKRRSSKSSRKVRSQVVFSPWKWG